MDEQGLESCYCNSITSLATNGLIVDKFFSHTGTVKAEWCSDKSVIMIYEGYKWMSKAWSPAKTRKGCI